MTADQLFDAAILAARQSPNRVRRVGAVLIQHNTARNGISTEGATLASTFFPCLECARAIVQVGITHLLTLVPDLSDPVWGESFVPSTTILAEGGVNVTYMQRDAAQVHASTMSPPD